MPKVIVENIVASTSFADKLDLDVIAQSLEEAEYEPEQFPGLVYRLDNPKTATLLFRSGKANCTGAKNVEDVRKTVNIIADKLEKIGIDVYKNPATVIALIRDFTGSNELRLLIKYIVLLERAGLYDVVLREKIISRAYALYGVARRENKYTLEAVQEARGRAFLKGFGVKFNERGEVIEARK